MDKIPIILFGVLFGIIVIPFSILIITLLIKGKKQAWKGTIIDKERNERRDDDTNRISTYYTIVVKLEDGKEAKIAVDSGRYNQWNVGDKLEKKSGQMWPEKI